MNHLPVPRLTRMIPAVLTALVLFAMPARADSINFFSLPGTENLGSFTGTLTVNNTTATTSTVTYSITNSTTPASLGGVITGMAFNDPTGSASKISSVLLSSVKVDGTTYTNSYSLFGGSSFENSVNGQPFGSFDVGAGTGVSFQGGSTLNGVGTADPGETVEFKYAITWDSAYAPTASDFMKAMSSGGSDSAAMLVRYQGFCLGGSDKVPGTGEEQPNNPVPAPPAILLAGIGLGCGFIGRSLRRRFAAA